MSDGIELTRYVGEAIGPVIPDLAALRIRVFREFPYLYDGNEAYEREYLAGYCDSAQSVAVVARDGDRAVGVSTGMPLADEAPEFQAPFRDRGYDLGRVFYFAESVLLPEYRGRGIGKRFFDEREAHVTACGGYAYITFCAVDRPPNHPRRPPGYRPLDGFWESRGFRKTDLRTEYRWRDLDETDESPKPMTFWLRKWEHPAGTAP